MMLFCCLLLALSAYGAMMAAIDYRDRKRQKANDEYLFEQVRAASLERAWRRIICGPPKNNQKGNP